MLPYVCRLVLARVSGLTIFWDPGDCRKMWYNPHQKWGVIWLKSYWLFYFRLVRSIFMTKQFKLKGDLPRQYVVLPYVCRLVLARVSGLTIFWDPGDLQKNVIQPAPKMRGLSIIIELKNGTMVDHKVIFVRRATYVSFLCMFVYIYILSFNKRVWERNLYNNLHSFTEVFGWCLLKARPLMCPVEI